MRRANEPKRVMLGGRLPYPLVRGMRDVAVRRGMTLQAVLERAVREFLKRQGRA